MGGVSCWQPTTAPHLWLQVMHSDHGWHLGEYNMWEKRTLWENAARVPLVLRAPWLPQSAGARVAAPVELVDIFKTVCDALGIVSGLGSGVGLT